MGKQQTKTLTPEEKAHWNNFVDYLDKNGYKGKTALDNKNMALGQNLLNRFNQTNPQSAISYDQIAQVQKELQDNRAVAIAHYHANPQSFPGVKSEADIMANLSPVDGWLGSKTSTHKFPVGIQIRTDGAKSDTTNLSTNVPEYNGGNR